MSPQYVVPMRSARRITQVLNQSFASGPGLRSVIGQQGAFFLKARSVCMRSADRLHDEWMLRDAVV